MIVKDPQTDTTLRSDRQVNLLAMIREAGPKGITFREIYQDMDNRPRNDAGVRMALDTLEEKQLVVREPQRKRGVRGRFPNATVRWFEKTSTEGQTSTHTTPTPLNGNGHSHNTHNNSRE